MKKTDSNRTEYQEFLYSLFQKYEIEPNESWSNSEWKSIVDSHLTNKKKLVNFYNELADYNIKNPSDQNWTHKIYEKSEEEEEVENLFKTCPFCAEEVKKAALKCRHCGEIFDNDKMGYDHKIEKVGDSAGSFLWKVIKFLIWLFIIYWILQILFAWLWVSSW
jgi:hypothetical protein